MKTLQENKHLSKFAPPLRLSNDDIIKQYQSFTHAALLKEVFNSLPVIIIILNDERQIVYSNEALIQHLGIKKISDIIGMRPGEVLHCIHSEKMEAGCGTSHECRFCGTGNILLESQSTKEPVSNESRITAQIDGETVAYDLQVTSKPFMHSDQWFYMLTIQDISDRKRRRALERIFFHDVTNTAFGLKGHVDFLIDTNNPETTHNSLPLLKTCSDSLVEEINSQMIIASAENNDLKPVPTEFIAVDTIKDVVYHMEKHYSALGKNIQCINRGETCVLYTDERLLKRVLINMLKNALEASEQGDTITLGCRLQNNEIEFTVNNPGHISEEVRSQIFQRSFSTKGTGRGLGTYSMKLLTEKYLNGRISFSSEESSGITFSISLPLKHSRSEEHSQ